MKGITVIKTFLFAVTLVASLGLGGQAAFAAETYYLGDYESREPGQCDWEDVYNLMLDLVNGDTIQITAPPPSATRIYLFVNDITIIGLGDTSLDLSIQTSAANFAANLMLQDITMTSTNGCGVNFMGTGTNTLTVEGTVSITGTSNHAVSSGGGIEIRGNGSLNATGGAGGYLGGRGIFAIGNITISAPTTATGGNGTRGGAGILAGGNITISAPTTAAGGFGGGYGDGICTSGGDIIISGGVVAEANGGDGADFWHNSSNKISVTSSGATLIGSSRDFEAKIVVEDTANSLTLENITMTAPSGYGVNFMGIGTNTLTVEGTVSITGSGTDGHAVYSDGSLTISGSGSLNATGGDSIVSGYRVYSGGDGISAGSNIIISAQTTATGGEGDYGGDGISAYGEIDISAQTTVTGGHGDYGGGGIYAYGEIKIFAQITATGGDGISAGGNIIISSSAIVEAKGGDNRDGGYGGDGISASSGDIEISAQTTATGGDSHYIGFGGHGINAFSGDIEIYAQTTAIGGNVSIGSIYISRGGYGIFAGGNITISAQTTATGGYCSSFSGGGTGIVANGDIAISAQTTTIGGDGYYKGGYGIIATNGNIIIFAPTTATGGYSESGEGGGGIYAEDGDITISAQTTATGSDGYDDGGIGILVITGELKISGVVTATGGNSESFIGYFPFGNAIVIYDDAKSVILEETGDSAAKLILKDGANATKTEGTKTDPNLNLTMAQALGGKAKWVISPASEIIGGVKDTNVAVLTTTSTIEVYLNKL